MKRIAILIVLVASTLVSKAQNKLGTWSVIPHVGVSISSLLGGSGIYEIGIEQGTEVKTHALLGFVGGADVMYQASDAVSLSAGLSFVQAGCKLEDYTDNHTVVYDRYLRINYVSMPILVHNKLLPGLLTVFIYRIQLIYFMIISIKDGKKTNFQEDTYDFDIKNGMHKFGLSIPVGVSYEYENVVLGALYHVGVFNIYKKGDSSRNSVFEVSVGYKLNL